MYKLLLDEHTHVYGMAVNRVHLTLIIVYYVLCAPHTSNHPQRKTPLLLEVQRGMPLSVSFRTSFCLQFPRKVGTVCRSGISEFALL